MAWIHLSRVHYKKSEEWREAYDAVQASREDKRAVFPLSLSHLQETINCSRDGPRARLLDFMWELSDGFAMCPWPNLVQPEAYNTVRQLMGQPVESLWSTVFGIGIPKILGAKPTLIQKTPGADPPPDELQSQIAEIVYGPEAWKILKKPEMAEAIREASELGEDFAENLQQSIDQEYSHPDKNHRQKLIDVRSLTGEMGDAFVSAVVDLVDEPKQFLSENLTSKEDALQIRRSMPTYHTFHVLNDARNKNAAGSSGSVDANDVWDLALSSAIPYCDVVYTEHEWRGYAEQQGLDELRGTRIVSNPSDLAASLGG